MQSTLIKARASLEDNGFFAHGAIPAVIADSWRRCLDCGFDPQGRPIDADVSPQVLLEAKQKHEKLLTIVRPELELLSNQIAGTNYLTAFADSSGIVLDVIMDNEFRKTECARSIRPGTIWSETIRGTNGLGLAMHTGKTSMVTGKEHFYAKHGGVSCISVPIFNSRAEIVGLLDASSEVEGRQHHTQALVSLAATNIENRYFVDEHRGSNIIQFHAREEYLTTQSVGMISVDEEGRVEGLNQNARDMLGGIDFSAGRVFSDLFQGDFHTVLRAMQRGKIVRLSDGLNAAYFARSRMTRPNSSTRQQKYAIGLKVPTVYSLPEFSDAPVFRDEQVLNSLRLAKRSSRLGLPLHIIGGPGSGRTTFAQAVHADVHRDKPLIFLDCQSASTLGDAEHLLADVFDSSGTRDFSIRAGGTLVLENFAHVRGDAAEKLARITNQMLQQNTASKWLIISTGTSEMKMMEGWSAFVESAFSKLSAIEIHLPALTERTDFSLLATALLSNVSPTHQLSDSAVRLLRKLKPTQNLHELSNHVRILAAQCPVGIIRASDVERYIALPNDRNPVCSRCEGNTARAAKCREINRVLQQCNSNISIAARKLGICRNTVYSHIAELDDHNAGT